MQRLRNRLSHLVKPGRVHLLTELVRANFKRTDHDTILGVLWSLVMPVAFTLIMFFLFRNRFSSGGPSYAVFILIGITTVGFVIHAVSAIMLTFVSSRELVLNTLVPRELLMVAALLNASIKYGIELIVALVCGFLVTDPWWPGLIFLPVLLLSFLLMILGFGMVFALISSVTRDVRHLWGLISRVLLFATPVFYELRTLSKEAAVAIYYLNPITPFLISLRWIIMGNGTEPFAQALTLTVVNGFVLFILVYSVFLRFENSAVERA